MSAVDLEFPALYDSANQGSIKAQRWFLWTIRLEYILLFCVSVAGAAGLDPFLITCVLFILAGLLLVKAAKKPDQDWYRCRALAESVKTSTWRFSMRAHPFEDASSINTPKAYFRNMLQNILKANQRIAANLAHNDTSEIEQVTSSMIAIRNLPLEDRMKHYVANRIDDQRAWYIKKAKANGNALCAWVVLTITVYIAAAAVLNSEQFGRSSLTIAFAPMIVFVTSALGWLQMKRHGELKASYTLAAHEIGIIKSDSESVKTEKELSDFINEAELAFSREHTQWVARRDAN